MLLHLQINNDFMKIEIITIGDELLIGQIVDTNAVWMARELTQRGFDITAISSVGDNYHDIKLSIDNGFKRADILLLTGGIGPTNDDITKNTLCQYFNTHLELNYDVLQNIESIFSERNISMNDLTKNQAYLPAKCTVIQNKSGTAPILWFNKDEKVLVSMPGVPYEMKMAMSDDIIPILLKKFKTQEYFIQSFIVTGISESALASLLEKFELQLPDFFSLAYLPSLGYIRLRLSVWGLENKTDLQLQKDKLIEIIGPYLVAQDERMPEEVLGEKLARNHLTVSTAESCTGGYISHKITLVKGSSAYYKGSIISYDNSVKTDLLNVDNKVIESDGVVSKMVVEQMAANVARKLNTNCSIAVSGIMGPDGGTPNKPVGTVWIATLFGNTTTSQKYNVGRSRKENIKRTTNLALIQLIKMLE